ncbi:chorismate synthase [Stratiformator vulcanicus]|uniref:Chorismate synthase n=1 Tax=Stratiformator vulcanicus TaxID=2527980 RepID=A0A517R072_9PLAN|nr:chorismate synthase [Stratiformator vulcanicus]QDT37233.1 Chorismate synthase [Stratiformator vulcanicus]
MAGNSFGQLFRITTAGESHGPGNVVIVDGVPPGIPITVEDLQVDLDRRRPGQSKIVTQRKEPDEPEILSGVFEGRTTGTSIAILIRNQDQRSKDYSDIKDKYRPGHADYTFDAKYGFRDYRGGGRSSARETTARVAAGVIAKKLIAEAFGGQVVGYVKQVGDIVADIPRPEDVTLEQVEKRPDGEPNIVRCPDLAAADRMIALIDKVRKDQDSIGGVSEIVATGIPPGLGEPVFDKIKADLAKALFSLPAVLGVEYGIGFACATMRGSENNDVFERASEGARVERPEARAPSEPEASAPGAKSSASDNGPEVSDKGQARQPSPSIATQSNRHGGMLGGITSGMPIVLRAAIKPTSSLSKKQPTVDNTGTPTTIQTKGRHDPCLLPRFVPMGEAMVAIVIADHWLRWRAQCGWAP